MALQALSEYAILSYVGGVNLTISLASTNLDFQETFELNRDNKKLLQSARVIGVHHSGDPSVAVRKKLLLIWVFRHAKRLILPIAPSLLRFNNK